MSHFRDQVCLRCGWAWSSNYILRRWAGAGEGIWASDWHLHQCRGDSCLLAWLDPFWVLPPIEGAVASPASRVHATLQQNTGFELVRWRVNIQTNCGSPRSVDEYFLKLSLITVYVIFSHFPELMLTEQSGEGQQPEHLCKLNCRIKLHQKKNGNLWTYSLFWFWGLFHSPVLQIDILYSN